MQARRSGATGRWAAALACGALLLVLLPAAPAGAVLDYADLHRIDAATPIAASIAISQQLYGRDEADAVVLARVDNFPDALGAAALTSDANGPLLLTATDALDPDVKTEIGRVLPAGGTVFLLGGTASLSGQIEKELDDAGYRTPRFAGSGRIETAAQIARYVRPGPVDSVILVRAFGNPDQTQGWVDSVSCGAWAAETRTPILLTISADETVAQASLDTMQGMGVRTVVVCGGTGSVSAAQVTQLRGLGMTVRRFSGASRVTTATDVATRLWGISSRTNRQFVVVPGFGTRFGFGLVAAPLAARLDAPILLVDTVAPTSCADPGAGATICYLESLDGALAGGVTAVGGTSVISDGVLLEVAKAARLAQDTTAPDIPANVTATDVPEDDGSQLDVAWDAVSDPDPVTYDVYARDANAGGAPTDADRVATTSDTSLRIDGLAAGTAYEIRIVAIDSADNRSAFSPKTIATPTDEIPAAPTTKPDVVSEAGGLRVIWVASNEADVVGYLIDRATEPTLAGDNCADLITSQTTWERLGGPGPTVDGRTQSSYLDATVASGSTYCYRFAPIDSSGNVTAFSPPSDPTDA